MPSSLFRPWRSVWLPRILTAVALLAGLPLYLRMPLWCDLTLYDMAARNILEGGVHYRDVFDTNLPGFVWALACIRTVFGFGAFALHCVDLAIVVGIVLLIDHLAKRGGATPATRWWAIAGAALIYPFATEMTHCQRDVWMALPCLAAMAIRLSSSSHSSISRAFGVAVTEGALWGLAVWIKPHVVLMAAGVWLFTAWRLAGSAPKPWRAVAADLLGNIVGGLVVGVAGIVLLVATGTWPEFWHVISVWGPEYAALGRDELQDRVKHELHWFPPWSLWLLPTLPLALLSMIDAIPWVRRPEDRDSQPGPVGTWLPEWLWDREADTGARFARATLAVLWLIWSFQAFYVQREFVYAHLTETLLMFGLWASHRWAMPAIVIVWLLLVGVLWLIADASPSFHPTLMTVAEHDGRSGDGDPDQERYLVRHPIFDLSRMQYWGDCWCPNLTDHERYVLWDRIKRIQEHEASPGWEELEEVAAFLRSQGVKDYELIAWHDSPHAIYLTMHLRPGLRYMHTNTAMSVSVRAHNQVLSELEQSRGRARFVLSDLKWAAQGADAQRRLQMLGPPRTANDLLPAEFGDPRDTFPFNQPTVFRSRGGLGRYIVHQLETRSAEPRTRSEDQNR